MKIRNLALVALVCFPVPLIGQTLTDDMVAYWKLDEIVGGRTPDAAGSLDMTVINLTAADVVAGKWGNAIQFSWGRNTLLERLSGEGEALPLEQYLDFSVSIWVKGDALTQASDSRVFSEASTQNNTPLFNIGTHNTAADGTVDAFVRGSGWSLNHGHTDLEAFDDEWHHILWVQTGDFVDIYVDGVLAFLSLNTTQRPLVPAGAGYRLNSTSIGGIRRAAATHWFTGLIDDVAVWSRALTEAEAVELATNGTPDPGVLVEPLEVRSFTVERTKVAVGSNAVLRWEGSKDAMFSIDQGVGAVDDVTVLGAGQKLVEISADTTFTLTLARGGETATATVSVTAVPGIEPGWVFVDDFEGYAAGPIVDAADEFWSNPNATPLWYVVDDGGNGVLAVENPSLVEQQQTLFTRLGTLAVADGESRSVYFHLKTDETDFGIKYHIGLSNKGLRGFQEDTDRDLGGFLVVERFDVETDTTLYSGGFDFPDPEFIMTPGEWHRVWIDVTNSAGDEEDVISAYVQREGETTRTVLFENSIGDRGNGQDLIYFFVASESGNLADRGLRVDNVFFSASGTLGTDPLGGGSDPGGEAFRITSVVLDEVAMEVTLVWSGDAGGTYKVESSATGVGAWREEVDELNTLTATVAMEGEARMYRVRRTD